MKKTVVFLLAALALTATQPAAAGYLWDSQNALTWFLGLFGGG